MRFRTVQSTNPVLHYGINKRSGTTTTTIEYSLPLNIRVVATYRTNIITVTQRDIGLYACHMLAHRAIPHAELNASLVTLSRMPSPMHLVTCPPFKKLSRPRQFSYKKES